MISSPVDQVFRTIITQALLLPLILCLNASGAMAGSATWSADPVSSDWTDPSNWLPETVPNGPTDVASFGASDLTDVSLSDEVGYELDSMVFLPGANSYNVSLGLFISSFTVEGAGIVNQSAVTQNIILIATPGFRANSCSRTNPPQVVPDLRVMALTVVAVRISLFTMTSSAGSGTFTIR